MLPYSRQCSPSDATLVQHSSRQCIQKSFQKHWPLQPKIPSARPGVVGKPSPGERMEKGEVFVTYSWSFLAYSWSFLSCSPLRYLLDVLSICKQRSSDCKQSSSNCKQKAPDVSNRTAPKHNCKQSRKLPTVSKKAVSF